MNIIAEIVPVPVTSTTNLLPKYRLTITGEGTNRECEEALKYLFKQEKDKKMMEEEE